MMRVRVVMALGLLAACAGVSSADEGQQAPAPSAKVDSVKQGPGAGSLAIGVSWKDCKGITGVNVTVDTADSSGGNKKSKTIGYTAPPTLNTTGSWSLSPTGFTSGHNVTKVTVDVFGAGNLGIATDSNNSANITVP